ncbi:MAG: hypothetical protein ACRBK7_15035 [Acidimicrobiales bacterium]
MEKWQEQTPYSTSVESNTDRSAQELTSIQFAQIARQLNNVANEYGLGTPAFRSPPRVPGLRRSIKRRPDGSATVSVSLRGRPAVAVVADMIDGVIAANEAGSTRSIEIVDRLWLAATPFLAFDAEQIGERGPSRSYAPATRAA